MDNWKIEKRNIKGCPICYYPLLAQQNDNIICLSPTCSWTITKKRKEDDAIPVFKEIRAEFNG